MAMFIPFRAQQVFHPEGIYYGQNVISKNMLITNRKQLLNGNSFILGISGSGKSFTTNVKSSNPNSVEGAFACPFHLNLCQTIHLS
nr:hypothetical protein [Paenibacillus sp. BGI2013]